MTVVINRLIFVLEYGYEIDRISSLADLEHWIVRMVRKMRGRPYTDSEPEITRQIGLQPPYIVRNQLLFL